ncbi:two-component system sensor histidine kinase NtrB [Desulfoluna spongiiphila]|uniref:histidine kinase n=1 Tax=Desulfoluna spongiiphila TaxID=419481 RepID=A0A1G5CP72_9BACT|nr:ATP-binding protein [Desulfoluna spongiiphila]SCY04154.1 PAS domain S-box-containing protein [Desulfoluna spongiiphila]VVS92319.1 histidine kinase domain [Desulfoluna spongiiphila]
MKRAYQRDILKEKSLECHRLAGALRMKEHALANSINAVFFADAKGMVFEVNPAFLKLWGYDDRHEVLGCGVERFFLLKGGFAQWRGRVGEKGGDREMTAVKKNGTVFPVKAAISLFEPAGRRGLGVMGACVALTEKSRSEEFKRQSLKLLALGHLSAGLAHELRNPLAVISSCAQFSIENLTIERPLAENLQVIYRNSQKASRLIEELLSFAKPSNLDWKRLSLNAILGHVVKMARLEASQGSIQTCLKADPNLPRIVGDREKLEQVFLNITLNAFQAVSTHGRVTLTTRHVKKAEMVEVNIIDNGPGIPEEYREQVFDPFFTTKDNGTGLGLSISHAIIKQHGGQIRITGGRRNGTDMSILLPIASRNGDGPDGDWEAG